MKKYKKEMIGNIIAYIFIIIFTIFILKNINDVKWLTVGLCLILISLEIKVYYMEVVKEWNEKLIEKLKE